MLSRNGRGPAADPPQPLFGHQLRFDGDDFSASPHENRFPFRCLPVDGPWRRGLAAAVYGQHPPLANASRAPGQWQAFDLVWTAPRFDTAGKLVSKARITLLHNGVLVQNNGELEGPTTWIMRPPYQAHPERLPIVIQDHGHPVQFRNIWVRELGNPRHPEFQLPDALLDSYVASTARDRGRAPGSAACRRDCCR
ncbi:MAG TPA: DUF1080 domain-containing protein [Lacunisphaera sp.]|nr:DUF1080 domain-containing protein [Lacunisphaera sp.]